MIEVVFEPKETTQELIEDYIHNNFVRWENLRGVTRRQSSFRV